MADKNSFWDTIGRRAELSMIGKAIIGIAGGALLLISMLFRECNSSREEYIPNNISWLEYKILYPSVTLDKQKRAKYYSQLGIDTVDVDSVVDLLRDRIKGGKIVRELNANEIDSIRRLLNFESPEKGDVLFFYINSFDSSDFIIVIEDSLVENILLLPQEA